VEKEENYGELLKSMQKESEQKKMNASRLLEIIFGAGMFINLRISIGAGGAFFLNCASAWTESCRICCI